MARTTGPQGWGVATKLFAILDAFGADRPSLTLSELSQRTGIPLSTARRLIQELVAWGALERLPEGSYRIGMRLWEVGSLAPRQRGLREAAWPYMQDLYDAARQNVQLVVLEGVEALCVARIHGRGAVQTELDVGERLPLHATAAGKALLAFSSESLLGRVRETEPARFTEQTLDMDQLKIELQRVRRTGVAYSSEELAAGAAGVASPILDRRRHVLGAIGIVAHSDTQLDRFGPAVRTAAIIISRVLG